MEENKEKRASAPRSNQKLKIMYLLKILLEKTDESHDITLNDILEELKLYDVTAERKSIYSDIEYLELYGFDIVKSQYDRTYHYQIVNRDFELVELKLLVDAVQAAKFITEKKSDELIKKLEKFTSKYHADKLQRQVKVNGRDKAINERIYYSIDAIHDAISENKRIEFQYFTWNTDKKMELKHDGMAYRVSPWALCWDEEKYYLIAYDSNASKIKHFRVDKMLGTKMLTDARDGKKEFSRFNMAEYSNRLFGMFEGEVERVELLCPNNMANVIIDRFGIDVPIIKTGKDSFTVKVDVATTDFFFGWVMALKGVRLVGPEKVVIKMRDKILQQYNMYL